MKTVHFFAFYLHNLPKITFFTLWSSMNPKIQNLYILMVKDEDVLPHFQFLDSHSVLFRCAISLLQISASASLRFYSCFYDDLLLLLWWFTPAFMMIYSCFHDEVLQYRLNHNGYSLDFVSDVDWSIFLPRIQNFQARKILVSSRENFMLNTRIHFILYENEVHSGKEWSVFS